MRTDPGAVRPGHRSAARMPSVVPVLLSGLLGLGLAASAAGCRDTPACPRCGTLVIAAIGEPATLLPPLVGETVGRDISDQIFERLADLPGGASSFDSSALIPRLAASWDRVDSLTLRFRLRPGARWHDGVPVTAGDVAFSFASYADSAPAATGGEHSRPVVVSAADDSTVLVRFPSVQAEQWYDATWQVRVLPRHLWDSIPRARWAADTLPGRLVGSGPFRLAEWVKGSSLTLERVGEIASDAITRVIWRFTGDQDAALNLLLTHEADLLESIGDSARVARVAADSALDTKPYTAAVYGFLGFNLGARATAPFQSREVRHALALALDRTAAARVAVGPDAAAPAGPFSRGSWIAQSGLTAWSFDTTAAVQLLEAAGWPLRRDGVRARSGTPLSLDILVPGTSVARRNLAQVVQEMWRRIGVRATITSVDFPVFQERLRTGRFESYVGAWLDEPSPRQLAEQWTGAGIGVLNYSRYRSAAFDSLFRRAADLRGGLDAAAAAWREALDTLNADVPAIWLYNPTNVAGVAKRVQGVRIDAFSWVMGLREWTLVR